MNTPFARAILVAALLALPACDDENDDSSHGDTTESDDGTGGDQIGPAPDDETGGDETTGADDGDLGPGDSSGTGTTGETTLGPGDTGDTGDTGPVLGVAGARDHSAKYG